MCSSATCSSSRMIDQGKAVDSGNGIDVLGAAVASMQNMCTQFKVAARCS